MGAMGGLERIKTFIGQLKEEDFRWLLYRSAVFLSVQEAYIIICLFYYIFILFFPHKIKFLP